MSPPREYIAVCAIVALVITSSPVVVLGATPDAGAGVAHSQQNETETATQQNETETATTADTTATNASAPPGGLPLGLGSGSESLGISLLLLLFGVFVGAGASMGYSRWRGALARIDEHLETATSAGNVAINGRPETGVSTDADNPGASLETNGSTGGDTSEEEMATGVSDESNERDESPATDEFAERGDLEREFDSSTNGGMDGSQSLDAGSIRDKNDSIGKISEAATLNTPSSGASRSHDDEAGGSGDGKDTDRGVSQSGTGTVVSLDGTGGLLNNIDTNAEKRAELLADTFDGGADIKTVADFIEGIYKDSRGPELDPTKSTAQQIDYLIKTGWSPSETEEDVALRTVCQGVRRNAEDVGHSAKELLTDLDRHARKERTLTEGQLDAAVSKLNEYDRLREATLDDRASVEAIGGPVAEQVLLLHDKIQKKEEERQELEKLLRQKERQVEVYETFETKLDTDWLNETTAATDPASRLQEGIETGVIGHRRISQAANSLSVSGTVAGQRLVQTLSDPRTEAEVSETLQEITDILKRWEQVERQVNEVDPSVLERRIQQVSDKTSSTSKPVTGLDELIATCRADLSSATDQNFIELHTIDATLDRIERSLKSVDSEMATDPQWDEVSSETDRLRQSVEDLIDRANDLYGIYAGNRISLLFKEVGDELAEQARRSAERGEMDEARAKLAAAELVYRHVRELYDDREYMRLLQSISADST